MIHQYPKIQIIQYKLTPDELIQALQFCNSVLRRRQSQRRKQLNNQRAARRNVSRAAI